LGRKKKLSFGGENGKGEETGLVQKVTPNEKKQNLGKVRHDDVGEKRNSGQEKKEEAVTQGTRRVGRGVT